MKTMTKRRALSISAERTQRADTGRSDCRYKRRNSSGGNPHESCQAKSKRIGTVDLIQQTAEETGQRKSDRNSGQCSEKRKRHSILHVGFVLFVWCGVFRF